MTVEYVVGDATRPLRDKSTYPTIDVIAHIVNNAGGWGAGFVVPLGLKYPYARTSYNTWVNDHKAITPFALGKTLFIMIQRPRLWVAHMCAQDGFPRIKTDRVVQYDALELCLAMLRDWCIYQRDEEHVVPRVHMPKIGSGLGGGDWARIEPMIFSALADFTTFIYVLQPSDKPETRAELAAGQSRQ